MRNPPLPYIDLRNEMHLIQLIIACGSQHRYVRLKRHEQCILQGITVLNHIAKRRMPLSVRWCLPTSWWGVVVRVKRAIRRVNIPVRDYADLVSTAYWSLNGGALRSSTYASTRVLVKYRTYVCPAAVVKWVVLQRWWRKQSAQSTALRPTFTTIHCETANHDDRMFRPYHSTRQFVYHHAISLLTYGCISNASITGHAGFVSMLVKSRLISSLGPNESVW